MEFEFPLSRGDYVAEVTRSDLVRYEDQASATLTLWLTCKNRNGICETALPFLIWQPDQELQQIERDRLQSVARAVGVEFLADSDQLHGRSFRMTVWNGRNMRFSFRPAIDAEKVREPGKDGGDGPKAA